jgi:peptide-methionine (R)-S-oxide reductase
MDKIIKTPAQWRGLLDAETYRVTREAGTERPFSGALYPENRRGTYHCVCCDAILFASATKFDAHCGWPSFWQEAVSGSITRIRDTSHGMERIEVRCTRCDAHLGHVFPDGPPPSGERYCINSLSMRFAPAD